MSGMNERLFRVAIFKNHITFIATVECVRFYPQGIMRSASDVCQVSSIDDNTGASNYKRGHVGRGVEQH